MNSYFKPPFSIQAAAINLRKSLLLGVSEIELIKLKIFTQELLSTHKLSISPSRLSPADRKAWNFLNQIEIKNKDFIQTDKRWTTKFPWQKSYRDFHLQISKEIKEKRDADFLYQKWQKAIIPALKELEAVKEKLEISEKNIQAIRGFQFCLEQKNFEDISRVLKKLYSFDWGKEAEIKFRPGRYLWQLKSGARKLELILDHSVIKASDEVLTDIYLETKGKKNRQMAVNYTSSEDYINLKKFYSKPFFEKPKGRGIFVNLDQVLAKVVKDWFPEMSSLPTICWLDKFSVRKLAHYATGKDEIAVSLVFDQPGIKDELLEFLVFHELLHRKVGIKVQNGRRMAHTPEFKYLEQQFPNAKKLDQKLTRFVNQL